MSLFVLQKREVEIYCLGKQRKSQPKPFWLQERLAEAVWQTNAYNTIVTARNLSLWVSSLYILHTHTHTHISLLRLFLFPFELLQLEPRASHLLGMCSTMELHARHKKIGLFNQLRPLVFFFLQCHTTITITYFQCVVIPQKKLCPHRTSTHGIPLQSSCWNVYSCPLWICLSSTLHTNAYTVNFLHCFVLQSCKVLNRSLCCTANFK